MNNFEELQSNWKNQPEIQATEEGFQSLLDSLRILKNKQRITYLVLGSTIIILIGFFFYIAGYSNQQVVLGITFMIGSLLIRILLEVLSIRNLNKMNMVSQQTDFRNDLLAYYKNRKLVHFLWTPIIITCYVIGFIILLPLFKATLSAGFYTYIIISSIVLLIFFSVFIAKQIRNEIRELKRLQED
jgi:hypothetical protein